MYTDPLKIMQFQERVRQILLPFSQIIDQAQRMRGDYVREIRILDREITRLTRELEDKAIMQDFVKLSHQQLKNRNIREALILEAIPSDRGRLKLAEAKNKIEALKRQIEIHQREVNDYIEHTANLEREINQLKEARGMLERMPNNPPPNENVINRIVTEYETRITKVINLIRSLKSYKGSYLIETRPYVEGKIFGDLNKRQGDYYLAGNREKVNEIFRNYGLETKNEIIVKSKNFLSGDKQTMLRIKPPSKTNDMYIKYKKNSIFGDI